MTNVNKVPLLDINQDNLPHRDEFVEALAAVVDSGQFLFGPDVVELENEVASIQPSRKRSGMCIRIRCPACWL